MNDHVHKRGEQTYRYGVFSSPCLLCESVHYTEHKPRHWWDGYEAAIAAISANGLPDHEERLARVAEWFKGYDYDQVDLGKSLDKARSVIAAYHAWQKEEPNVSNP